MLKKMNLPNKLTMLRIILVPLFIIAMSLPEDWKVAMYVALGIYVVAAITDFLDGKISRSKGLVTEFGKIMDPLADKLLVASAFIMLTGRGIIPAYITAIIILRDLFANSIRMFGANENVVIPASLSGKIKTASQLFTILFALIDIAISTNPGFLSFLNNSMSMSPLQMGVNVFMSVLIILTVVVTIVSLIDYIIKFKKYINIEK